MSRHEFINAEGQEVVYGYDRPLCEYFIDIRDPSIDAGDDGELNVVLRASSIGMLAYDSTRHSNSEMFTIMRKAGVPDLHLNCVALDLEIPELDPMKDIIAFDCPKCHEITRSCLVGCIGYEIMCGQCGYEFVMCYQNGNVLASKNYKCFKGHLGSDRSTLHTGDMSECPVCDNESRDKDTIRRLADGLMDSVFEVPNEDPHDMEEKDQSQIDQKFEEQAFLDSEPDTDGEAAEFRSRDCGPDEPEFRDGMEVE